MTEEMEKATNRIVAYLLHDPIGNCEGYVSNYDPDLLAKAQEGGMIVIAEHEDGRREVVDAKDVKEPNPAINGVAVVLPPYVDKRTAATVACFDALSAIVDPQPATADETGEGTEAVGPVEAFRSALAALKALEATE